MTNICSEATVRDASQRDCKVFVPQDGTGEIDPLRYEGAIASTQWLFAKIVTVDEVIDTWGGNGSRP